MYTGIIQALVPVESIDEKEGLTSFSIRLPDDLTHGLETGASIAINGVCFTVTRLDGSTISFDAIRETLALSNIKYVQPGAQVNFERSAQANAEVGGHILAGHVVDTARIIGIERDANNCRITFAGKPEWMKYVFDKGFLALNGASLTVTHVDREKNTFSVNLIPETLQRTNFSLLNEGDEVNVEIEHQTQIIVDTVERILQDR